MGRGKLSLIIDKPAFFFVLAEGIMGEPFYIWTGGEELFFINFSVALCCSGLG